MAGKTPEKKPGSMVIHLDEAQMIRYLTDRDRGRLFLALIDYAQEGVLAQGFKGSLAMCYEQMRHSIDRNIARYQETCERNRETALKRWGRSPDGAPLDAPACGGMHPDTPYANSNANPTVTPNININPTVTPGDTQAATRAKADAQTAAQAAIAEARARRRELLHRLQEGDSEARRLLVMVDAELDTLLKFQAC